MLFLPFSFIPFCFSNLSPIKCEHLNLYSFKFGSICFYAFLTQTLSYPLTYTSPPTYTSI
jgi:hypothetical protein